MSELVANRGERDELKYLSTRAGLAPGKVPVGGMSELDPGTDSRLQPLMAIPEL
jgi:hypothetical protein